MVIKPKKQDFWDWGLHHYATKQPYNVVRHHIKTNTKKNDLVLDPFCGTGVTGIQSLVLKRKSIQFDINPLASFISETVPQLVNLDRLKNEFYKIFPKISELEKDLYSLTSSEIEKYSIKDWYPKNIKLPENSDFEFVHDLFDKKQLIVFSRLLKLINKIEDRLIKKQFLLIYSNTLNKVNLTYMYNEQRGLEGGGPSFWGKGRYWRPKKITILKVCNNFESRFKKLLSAKTRAREDLINFKPENNLKVYNDDATNIKNYLKPNSVDYIYTDPPYGANIAYLDLSIIFNSWLGFEKKIKYEKEIIEGGNLNLSKDHYYKYMFQSAKQMYDCLKPDRNLSLVFQHKDHNMFNRIIDCFRDVGFKEVGVEYQETQTTSLHKKKNPLNVFGNQMILKFKKKLGHKSRRPLSLEEGDMRFKIKQIANKTILGNLEASSEEISADVINELFKNNLLHKKVVNTIDLNQILKENFNYNSDTNKWIIDEERKMDVITLEKDPNKRLFYIIASYLRENEKVTFDKIVSKVTTLSTQQREYSTKSIKDILSQIAISEGKYYKYTETKTYKDVKEVKSIDPQLNLFKQNQPNLYNTKKLSKHNNMIFELVNLSKKMNLKSFVGITEQNKEKILKDYSDFPDFPFPNNHNIKKYDQSKINQIDLIWLNDDYEIEYAFEVETSTSIKTGLERFISIFKASYTKVRTKKRLFILIPKNKKSQYNKFKKEIEDGTFSGYPFFLDKFVKYAFIEDVILSIKNNSFKTKSDIDNFFKLFD